MWEGSFDGVAVDGYTATEGFFHLFQKALNGAADGTGIGKLVPMTKNLVGDTIPAALVNYAVTQQNSLFGAYPHTKDVAPSAIFLAVYAVLMVAHLGIFIINFSRGHYFALSLVWAFYCVMRVIGWAMRISWSKDITRVQLGIADEVFLILASIVIVTTNLILAQRLFTWRHPVGGSRRLFWNTMLTLYAVVLLVIAMTIVASAVPYMYFLSDFSYESYKKVVMVSAILIILYTLTAVSLIGLAYFFKPTRKDENLYTYQPWWIDSFHPLYFVRKNAAQEAEETFMKRDHNHRHAIRVIAATHHHYNVVEGLTNERGNLQHNWSLFIISASTLFLFITSVGRAVVVFSNKKNYQSLNAANPVFMYICWGLLEVIINLMFLVGRVDLRFYRPDVLPAKVRAIITAQQSLGNSEPVSRAESIAPSLMDDSASGFEFDDDSSSPPHYYDKEEKKLPEDNESEFFF